jgi:hypothetical protein
LQKALEEGRAACLHMPACWPEGCTPYISAEKSVETMQAELAAAMADAGVGICRVHALDFPFRIRRTLPFCEAKKTIPYCSGETWRAGRSTIRKDEPEDMHEVYR